MVSFEEVRRCLDAGEISYDQALLVANTAVREQPSASWWLLRGRLVLLSESPGYDLADAEASFLQAVSLDPDNPEAYEELGRHYDRELEPERARAYFRAALERGAGPDCAEALAAVEGPQD